MMDLSQRKQQFSIAYVHAVATVAGFTLYDIRVDDDSIDLGIASRIASDIPRAPRIDLQLKCTSDKIVKGKDIRFSLKRKNYDDLRVEDLIVPKLLDYSCDFVSIDSRVPTSQIRVVRTKLNTIKRLPT